MRLKQIERNLDLLNTLKLSIPRAMSRTETKRSIDDYYARAMAGDEMHAWYRNGVIANWQLAMNGWLAEIKTNKVQRLDNQWRSYVAQLHYEHYLLNRQAMTRMQIQQAEEQIAYLNDELAQTQINIERYIGGNDKDTE